MKYAEQRQGAVNDQVALLRAGRGLKCVFGRYYLEEGEVTLLRAGCRLKKCRWETEYLKSKIFNRTTNKIGIVTKKYAIT